MAKVNDITVEILKQIRDEVAGVRVEVRDTRDALSARIDATNARLDATNEKVDTLGRRQTEADIRVATELVEVANAVHGLKTLLRDRLDDRERVEDHERRISALEQRKAG